MPNKPFFVGGNPPICFSLQVIASDLSPKDENFQAKIVFDFAPPFDLAPNIPNFNANKVHELLEFISDRLLKKVIESVYYDRGNEQVCKTEELPYRYKEAMKIYDERLALKKKTKKGDSSYLDHREEKQQRPKAGKKGKPFKKQASIEEIVGKFFTEADRPVWDEETNVTKVTFEQMSPPTLTVETKTAVNGDKRPR